MAVSLAHLQIDSPTHDTVNAQASATEVDMRLREDYEFFAEFFLAEELSLAIPDFHHQTWQRMIDPQEPRVITAIPREHAKTTQAKLVVVYHFMFTERRFCAYLSNTNTIALQACKDIFAFFHTQNYVATYGAIEVETASEGASLWIFKIRRRNGTWKRCILRAVGANQQMRGINIDNQRPDIAIVDDVEDLDNTESIHRQQKLDQWIFATFIKALTRDHKIIWIGNMLRKTTLLARLTTDIRFRDKWTPLVLGALIRNPITQQLESLWPELWTVEELQRDFLEYQAIGQSESWFCEMMNMPGHGESGFQPEDMFYAPVLNPEDYLATFITVDPAFGMDKEKNDATAIVVHGIPEEGPPQVCAYTVGHLTEIDIFNQCIDYTRYWGCYTWGVERVAAQKVLLTLFEVLLLRKREHRVAVLPLQANTHESKGARIKAFVNLMKAKEYALPYGDLDATTQFLAYDLTLKEQSDDLIDSIAYGPQMLILYRGAIIQNARMAIEGVDMPKIRYGMQVANV